MEKLIKQIHVQWLLAKREAEEECERRGLQNMAERYRKCDVFKGDETLDEVIRKFTTPVGLEFALSRHFPTLATLRLFKPYHPERFGCYVDAGAIELRNPEKTVLIGRTVATIYIDECKRHEVVLMRGAKATIVASKWGFVKTSIEKGCALTHHVSDNAIIL